MEKLKTPYYTINKPFLEDNFLKFKDAACNYFGDNYIIGYSYKTNSLPWIIDYFKNCGCYAEVVSDDEYSLGKFIGVNNNMFIYNGPCKTKETFLEALKNGCFVNIDSHNELEWLNNLDSTKKYNIGLRVNIDIEKECKGQSQCGSEGGRFGFCYENGELKKAIEMVQSMGLQVSGLHMHCSSKTRSLEIYKALSKYAGLISREYHLHISYIDIGGGFFGGMPDKPQFADYFHVIRETLSNFFDMSSLLVIFEPGMALIGAAISFVTSVIDVKNTTYNRFIILDGSRINVDPLMNKTRYDFSLQTDNRRIVKKQVISGFTCMEHDRLFELLDSFELSNGDKVVFKKVGAYTMSLSPLFIKYFPDVYVDDGNCLRLVRTRWTEKNYLSGSVNL